MKKLPPKFFARDTVEIAKDLLGKIIIVNGVKCRIVETEAYKADASSHARVKTDRSALMFDTYGHVYVYLIYGMYHCLNFTTEKDKPGAVLIRGLEPLNKIELLKQRRKTEKIHNLCSGPGKLCQALAIDKSFNGLKLGSKIAVYDDGFVVIDISSGPRIGIKEDLELDWRFFITDNKHVSKG